MGGDDATWLTAGQGGPNKEYSNRQREKDVIYTEERCQNKNAPVLGVDKWCKELLARLANTSSGGAVSSGHVGSSALYDHGYKTLPPPLLGHPTAPQNSLLTLFDCIQVQTSVESLVQLVDCRPSL